MTFGFFDQGLWILPSECDTARVRFDRLGCAAKHLQKRHIGHLGTNMPERHIDAAECECSGCAHAVACQLHFVDLGPDAVHIHCIHAENEFAHGGVDQFCDCPRAAAVVRLSPSNMAVTGFDPHQHCIAFDAAADTKTNRLVFRYGKRDRNCAKTGDFHSDGKKLIRGRRSQSYRYWQAVRHEELPEVCPQSHGSWRACCYR